MQAPPRIRDPQFDMPHEASPRCLWWVSRIRAGWRPGKHIRVMGYHQSAEWYGVHIWEYINVLSPLLRLFASQETYGPRSPMTEWYRTRSDRKKRLRSWVLRIAHQRGRP